MKKDPAPKIIDTLVAIADGSVAAAIKPIEAAHALGNIYYYILMTNLDVNVNYGNYGGKDGFAEAWSYNLQVARSADRYDHRQLLRDSGFYLGKMRMKGFGSVPVVGSEDCISNSGTPVVTSNDKAAICWFDKAIEDSPEGSNNQEIIYNRNVCRKNIEINGR